MEKGEIKFIGTVTKVKDNISTITLYPEYCPGLLDISQYTHLHILYWFHQRDNPKHRNTLQVVPKRHGETQLRGVFASRSPSRPNPIALTQVELIKHQDCTLTVKGLDAFEGSPIIDIKPKHM